MQENAEGSTMMGNYFDQAKNDDSFYLPPEVFQNPTSSATETVCVAGR